MKIAIIGRTEMLYSTAELLWHEGFEIPLIITSKEAPEYKKSSEDFRALSKKLDACFLLTPTLEKEEVMKAINKIPDLKLAISINFTGVISKKIIDLFPLGILNAHGGDLPRYRGNACQAWAIINREKKIGLCIHKMIGGELDSGNIIARDYLEININTRLKDVYNWIESVIGKLFLHSCHQLLKNPNYYIESQSKKRKDILRCYPRKPEDGQIKWNKSAEDIVRLINASSEPYEGAFAYFENKKIIIWRAKIFIDDENYLAIPGQISNIDKVDGSINVISAKGKINIIEVEYNGKRCSPASFIKSLRSRLK